MNTYMVVCSFKPDTDMAEMYATVADELAQVAVLTAEQRIGSIHISPARSTAFIEIFADDESSAEATIKTLPMSKWWDLGIYPTQAPGIPAENRTA